MSLHKYELLIREHHLDTFGHVNNARYLDLYEEARWELISSNGFSMSEIQKKKIGPVILEVNLKFQHELRLREKITITTELLDYNGKIGRLKQQMLKEDGSVASEAVFVFGLFDLVARKLMTPTDEWKRAIGLKA